MVIEKRHQSFIRVSNTPKTIIDNSTEINASNEVQLLKLAFQKAHEFWGQFSNEDFDSSTFDLFSKSTLHILNNQSKLDKAEKQVNMSFESTRSDLYQSIFCIPYLNRVYINLDTFEKMLKDLDLPLNSTMVTLIIFHEMVHIVQGSLNLMGSNGAGNNFRDPVRLPELFGLSEDIADYLVGVFSYYLELIGKAEDLDELLGLIMHEKVGTKFVNFPTDMPIILLLRSLKRSLGGHGNSEIRTTFYKKGNADARKFGVKKATMAAMYLMKKKENEVMLAKKKI